MDDRTDGLNSGREDGLSLITESFVRRVTEEDGPDLPFEQKEGAGPEPVKASRPAAKQRVKAWQSGDDPGERPRRRKEPAARSEGGRQAEKKRQEARTRRSETGRRGEAPRRTAQAGRKGKRPGARRNSGAGSMLVVLLLLFVIIAGTAFHYVIGKWELIQRLPWNQEEIENRELDADTRDLMKGFWTVAVFGVDSRDNTLGKGNNADVNIIVNVNHDSGEIRLVSVYRDTYMNTQGDNYNKINAAYRVGGPADAVKALNRNLDLNINDYATFNWKAVADAINLLGGIDVDITEDEFFYMNAFIVETVNATGVPSVELKQAGRNHLDGVQAVAYGRLRLMDTDFKRTERQRRVIRLTFDKMKRADLATLNQVIQVVFPQIATSARADDLLTMAMHISHYHLGETYAFPEDHSEKRIGSRGECVIPRTMTSNVQKLHAFLFDDENYRPTATVRKISDHLVDLTGLQ